MQSSYSQQRQFSFRHFTPNEGLSNEYVNAIEKDKAGFIWLATNYGLNRFDGHKMVQYLHSKTDSNSLADNTLLDLYADSQSNIWTGGYKFLTCLNQATQKFNNYKTTYNVFKITADANGKIFLGTNKGLKFIDKKTKQIVDTHTKDPVLDSLLQLRVKDLIITNSGQFYIAGKYGVLVLNWATQQYTLINNSPQTGKLIGENDVQAIMLDKTNKLLIATEEIGSKLYRLDLQLKTSKSYSYFFNNQHKKSPNRIQALRCDAKNNIWINTTDFGLTVLDAKTESFYSYLNDPLMPNSLASNICTSGLLIDNEGIIWIGVMGSGIDYFNPNKIQFSAVMKEPFTEKTLLHKWGRTMAEDATGNLWLGTARGVSVFNKEKGIIKNFDIKNLHNGSIRSMLNENDKYIWIGTASGVNKYDLITGKMHAYFIDDSISDPFIHTIYKTKTGKMYVGANIGLYQYLPEKDKFLKLKLQTKYKEIADNVITTIYEDDGGKLWFGSGNGVYVFDQKAQKLIKHFTETSKPAISDKSVRSFYPDKESNIWVGTFSGLNLINKNLTKNTIYSTNDGLPNNTICGLQSDRKNRLWIGTARGLCIMENGKIKHQFGLSDGLPTSQFNDQLAYKLHNGSLVFPSQNGYVIFDPLAFESKAENPKFYITNLNISGEKHSKVLDIPNKKLLALEHNENFFEIEMVALNFLNPEQSWYSYKLEGFDKDWVYTQESVAKYTNVPSGKYTFIYRASNNKLDWNVQQKTLEIWVETVFYKRWWFLALVAITLLGSVYLYFKWRLENSQKMNELTSKTQLLEKEKALVMYENLKQHLNPHFLFNSLTSLSSLIRFDQIMASDFLDKMSKVYRYILKNRDNETVALGEEIKFVSLYNQLQKTRFESGLDINIDIDEEHFHQKIAPVTLQNLVENAIKHNTASSETPLKIDLFIEGNYLVVQNNLQKKGFVETSNKQGLANMVSLYKYLSEQPMFIEENEKTFTVKIPLI
jgi:ligand-binding sensor domain-containing protein